jgi:hypothetical protein
MQMPLPESQPAAITSTKVFFSAITSGRIRQHLFLPDVSRFEQEPHPALCLVEPHLDEARGGDIVLVVVNAVSFAQARNELVITQLREHKLFLRPKSLRLLEHSSLRKYLENFSYCFKEACLK